MSTTHAIAALKAALRAHLVAHTPLMAELGGGVHDAPPRNASPPFATMSEARASENATNDADGVIIEIEIAVHTAERGTEKALAIARLIETRLASPPALTGWRLVLLTLRETVLKHDASKTQTRAGLRYRAFIEPL